MMQKKISNIFFKQANPALIFVLPQTPMRCRQNGTIFSVCSALIFKPYVNEVKPYVNA